MMQLAVLICLSLVVNTFAQSCVQDSDCGNDDQCCLYSACATKPGEMFVEESGEGALAKVACSVPAPRALGFVGIHL
uniref:U14-hexatoxin-Hi1a n=1 Tax=Hadronyche infensa TaxID=153481 RepID=TE1A_HADIN